MASGVTVQDACLKVFEDVKLRHQHRYVIYCLTDDLKEIEVKKCAPPESKWNDMIQDLTDARSNGECRYAVYDINFTTDGGQQRTKLLFILWSPDDAKIKQKMLYTSSKDAFVKKLVGISQHIQATEFDELNEDDIVTELKQKEYAN